MKTFIYILTIIFSFLSFESFSKSDHIESLDIKTEDIEGALVHFEGKVKAPVESVYEALIDFNHHAENYPRIRTSFCVLENQIEKYSPKEKYKPYDIENELASKKCDPYQIRKKNKKWILNVFQIVNYPFPLTNRWFFAKILHDETKHRERYYLQDGEMIFGKQNIYQLKIELMPHPENQEHTKLKARFRVDPGGIITGWMIKIGSRQTLPKLLEVIEIEALKREKK